jgi:hypothetical protein
MPVVGAMVRFNQDGMFSSKVTVSFRVYEKDSVWIRVAWGTQYSQPNQYKPTFVVYYPQTPYAFISSCHLKNTVPLLHQVGTGGTAAGVPSS